jgi:Cellulose binding domain
MTKKILNFLNNSKALLILCLILAIGLNLSFYNIFTNARPLSVISQNPDSITFGVSVEKEAIPNNINLVSGPWILSTWTQYNTDWLSKFTQPENINKTPYLYLYVAAGKARSDWNLEDCNMGVEKSRTLCYRGAEYLRNNREYVNQAYTDTANNIKKVYGSNREIALHIEPDFYQYTSSDQLNGGLSFDEAAKDLNEWTDTIKSILPNARLVMDVSPWNSDLGNWSSKMKNYDYAGIVGKAMSPNGDGTTPAGVDGKSYAKISQETGKQLILDDSHGVGGYWLPFDYDWSNKNLAQARLKDGVVAVLLPPNDLNFLNGMVKSSSNNPNSVIVNPKPIEQIKSSSSSISSLSSVVGITSAPVVAKSNIAIKNTEPAPIKVSAISSSSKTVVVEPNLNNVIVVGAPVLDNKPNPKISTLTTQSSKAKITPSFSQVVCSSNSIDISMTKAASWQNGFVTSVKVKNNSNRDLQSWSINQTPIDGQLITNMWNLIRGDNTFTANSEWNSKIKLGQEVEVGGFTTSFNAVDSMPSYSCGTSF